MYKFDFYFKIKSLDSHNLIKNWINKYLFFNRFIKISEDIMVPDYLNAMVNTSDDVEFKFNFLT